MSAPASLGEILEEDVMQCPKCRGEMGFLLVEEGRCPHCAVAFYVVDRWLWLRVIACWVPAVVVNSGWFPVPCRPAVVVVWFGAVGLLMLLLMVLSVRILPLHAESTPRHGPLRLDL